uniref:Cytochrome P450 n=1 Tax=Nothapodytes nimmoniana TaxID=159386 RepID=A0A7L7RB68_NOTNI|nr:cytochrome P450 [Nothapodytes nimmoniana]
MALFFYFEILLVFICFLLWSLHNKRGVPWNWPLLGMLPNLSFHIHRIHDRCVEMFDQTDGTFLFKGPWFANMDMLTTVDPANVHHIMSANFSNFPKGSEFMKIFQVLGDGIFNSDSELWKNQRKIARGLINHQRFYRFLARTVRDKVEKGLIPILDHVSEQGTVIDMQDVFQRLTFDSTCILVTGYDPGCLSIELPDVPFSKAMDDAEEAMFMRHFVPESLWKLERWLGIGQEKKLSRAWTTLDNTIAKYISMKQEELRKNSKPTKEEDGIDLLTSYIHEDYEIMGLKSSDDKFLRDSILNLMIAGRDTTSSALTWFLWLVSTHPEVQFKIREEIKSVFPSKEVENSNQFNIEELRKLTYLHAAISESLRLYPPVPFQHKAPLQPDILPSGHYVHPRMKIMFPLYAMGRMASIWGKDCREFRPERWISDSGTVRHEPSYKFLAFNAGPRTCLGKEVAFIQMKAVAVSILLNYTVEIVEGHSVSPNVSIILYMKHGLKVRVTKRCV